jgi:threonine/homoserine/homoserine lactone efflux protein
MPYEIFLSLIALAIVAAFTPGPNNALVANAAAHFGMRRTFPMIAGIGFGFPFMVFCIALGLGQIFEQSALFREIMRWGGVAILVWFAWKIATSPVTMEETAKAHPLSFMQMASFQWINPKGWAMAISVTSQFANPEAPIVTAALIASVFVAVGFSSASTWAIFGQTIRRFLTSPLRFRIFNIVMALLILMSVLAIAFPELYK